MRVSRRFFVLAVGALLGAACGSDADPTVSLAAPPQGAATSGGLEVTMAADGITIEEAGEPREGAGHFHLIADDGCATPGSTIAATARPSTTRITRVRPSSVRIASRGTSSASGLPTG